MRRPTCGSRIWTTPFGIDLAGAGRARFLGASLRIPAKVATRSEEKGPLVPIQSGR